MADSRTQADTFSEPCGTFNCPECSAPKGYIVTQAEMEKAAHDFVQRLQVRADPWEVSEKTLVELFTKFALAQRKAVFNDSMTQAEMEKAAQAFLLNLGVSGNTRTMAEFAMTQRKEAVQECDLAVLEQRCERGTPWDLAIVAASRAIREAFPECFPEEER